MQHVFKKITIRFLLQNVFFGVGGAVFSCVGDWTSAKQRGLLTLTLTILVMNIINLIILEIGEWRFITPESVKRIIMSQKGSETLVSYGKNRFLHFNNKCI